MSPHNFECKFTVGSELKYLPWLREIVTAAVLQNGFDSKVVMKSKSIITEAFDNAVIHAHHRAKHIPIDILVKIKGSKFTLEIKDRGKGFHLPKLFKQPSMYSSNHRGLLIINALADSISYSRTSAGNKLKVVIGND